MEIINLPQTSKLTSPNPLVLVCTAKPDGSTNLATVSWWTYLSFKPGKIGFAMSQKSYSGERVRETGKVTLAVPGEELAAAVMKCGSCSGRSTDKVAETNIKLQFLPDTKNEIPTPVHARVILECSLDEYVTAGDHYFYICDVQQVYGEETEKALFAWNGYGEVRTV